MSTLSAEWVAAARLLRRSGFGTTGAAVDSLLKAHNVQSYAAEAVNAAADSSSAGADIPSPDLKILSFKPGKKAGTEVREDYNKEIVRRRVELMDWWLRRMVNAEQPLREKLTLLWHNHFATSLEKVRYPAEMGAQNAKIRSLCLGDFRSLAFAMLTDAAMVRWLDGHANRAESPNENLAREFLELFALGHGNGYSEHDVREGARALTGWKIEEENGSTTFVPERHDSGPKHILGVTADMDASGFCDTVLAHPNSPRFVVDKLWRQLASDSPPTKATLARLLAAYGNGLDLRALTKAVLTDPEFFERNARVVISPVEWLVGLHRTLRVPLDTPQKAKKARATLKSLGQLPFYPPSVGGWPGGQSWLSAAAAGIRLRSAEEIIRTGDISTVEAASLGQRLDAVGYLFGIRDWSRSSANALAPLRKNPPALVAAAVNTPEYLVS